MNWCNSHYVAELAYILNCNSTGLPLVWDVGEAAENKDGFAGTGAGTAALPHSLWEPSCSLTLCRNPRAALEQEHNWALVPS